MVVAPPFYSADQFGLYNELGLRFGTRQRERARLFKGIINLRLQYHERLLIQNGSRYGSSGVISILQVLEAINISQTPQFIDLGIYWVEFAV